MFALILLTNFVAAIVVTMDATVTTKGGELAQWAFSVDQSIAWLSILSRVYDEIENVS